MTYVGEFAVIDCAIRDNSLGCAEEAVLIFDTRDQLIDFRVADAIKEIHWMRVRAEHDINRFLDESGFCLQYNELKALNLMLGHSSYVPPGKYRYE